MTAALCLTNLHQKIVEYREYYLKTTGNSGPVKRAPAKKYPTLREFKKYSGTSEI